MSEIRVILYGSGEQKGNGFLVNDSLVNKSRVVTACHVSGRYAIIDDPNKPGNIISSLFELRRSDCAVSIATIEEKGFSPRTRYPIDGEKFRVRTYYKGQTNEINVKHANTFRSSDPLLFGITAEKESFQGGMSGSPVIDEEQNAIGIFIRSNYVGDFGIVRRLV